VANLWVLDLKTRQARNLTGRTLPAVEGNLKGAFRPSWSPDGRWIAFTSDRHYPFRPHREPAPGWEHPQELSIYIIQADGQGLRRLTMAGVTTGSPKWSPDGKLVVYQKADFTARPQNQPLYSWDPGMDVRYTEVFPHFSKDGRLAVSEIRNLAATARVQVAVMNSDGSNRKVVYSGGPGAAFFPTWSPD